MAQSRQFSISQLFGRKVTTTEQPSTDQSGVTPVSQFFTFKIYLKYIPKDKKKVL